MIGIGGTLFLSLKNSLIGSIYFSLGLNTILIFDLLLYTGKVGFINTKNYLDLLKILFFNLIGIFIYSILIKTTNIELTLSAKTLISNKIQQSYIKNLFNAIGCGFFMYLAVNFYNIFKTQNKIVSILLTTFCVSSFIILNFNHCIADYFYIMVSNIYNIKTLQLLIIDIIGNSIGSILLRLLL